jgi:hypothetical protein
LLGDAADDLAVEVLSAYLNFADEPPRLRAVLADIEEARGNIENGHSSPDSARII